MFYALAELAGEGFQLRGGKVAKGAAEELLFQRVEFSGQVGKLVVGRGGDFLFDALLILEDAGLNFGLGMAAPSNERGFGDAELAANAGETQSLNAEAEEFVTDGRGVHRTK